MSASFHIIDKSTWERTIYFDYYYSQIKCKYNLNANIDITHLVSEQKKRNQVLSYDALCHYESCQSEQRISYEF